MVSFVLSCSTIPSRIEHLVKLIPLMKIRYQYFVINICNEYKRFGKFKVPKSLLQLCKKDKRVVFNFIDDFGPIGKYIGGFNFMKKKNLIDHKLIIIDDDILYNKDLFYDLIDNKNEYNITCSSGFNFSLNLKYNPIEGDCEFVEGYGGICFNYDQFNEFISFYSNYYKCINNFSDDDLIQKYLQASFLGDDFILSEIYKSKYAIDNGRKYLQPQQYGYGKEALHNNNIFGSNLGSYYHLKSNIEIFKTFQNKFKLNNEIKKRSYPVENNTKFKFDKPKVCFTKKVCIFTWYDEGIKEYADITSEINNEYCKREGFTFYKDDNRRLNDRTPHWERLPLFLELFKKKYDYVIWIDADACFRFHKNKLKEIINEYEKYNIIFSYDNPYSKNINSGFMIMKNNDYTKEYITKLINDKDPTYFFRPNWDQEKINQFYDKNVNNIKNNSCILSYHLLQDFHLRNPNSLIIHLAGIDKEKRIKIFSQLKNKIL